LLIGLESPVESGLAGLELKSDWKRKQWPKYREAIRKIQAHGIRVNGCFVLGLDDQMPEIFDNVYEFAAATELFDVQITIQTAFPGTPLYRRLRREKRLLDETAWERCTLFDINFLPRHMGVEELRDGFHHLALRLYGEEITQWRRDNFKSRYLRPAMHHKEVLP